MRIGGGPSEGCLVDQEATINKILRKHDLVDAKIVRKPIAEGEMGSTLDEKLPEVSTEGGPTVKIFQSLVESLLWMDRP